MFNTIVSTSFSLPLAVIANGETTGIGFTDPNNILLPDGSFAVAAPGGASDITIGNFDFLNGGIPNNAVVTGFEIQILGKRGSQTVPPLSLTLYAVDNTSGTNLFYPYTAPYTGLTTTNASHILGTQNYVFATSWTADQAQNFKLNLVANGDISLDTILINVYYYIPAPTPLPTPAVSGCIDCDSPIQVQAMSLELPFLANETKFYLKKGSFSYADGTPVQPGDVGTCGGNIEFVFDQGKRKVAGGNFAENVQLDTSTGVWTVLTSGVIEVDIFAVTNRGRQFHTPYGHDATLMSNHDANSEVIISNSGLFYSRFVRNCQVDIVFSPPIATLKDGVLIEPATHAYNYIGAGVSVVPNGTDPQQMDVTIPGAGGTAPPLLVATGSGTSGNVQVLTLQYDVESSGTDRGALVQISTEQLATVVSVDIGGTPAVQLVSDVDIPNNIRQEQWGCAAQPVGTLTVTVTLSIAAYISSGVETFANVDQATPFGAVSNATGASNTPSVVLPTTVDYSLVVDGLATAMTPILYTPGAGQISNWSETANTDTRQGGSSIEPAGTAVDNVTMDYSITQNTDWVITAVEVIGITSPTGGVQSVTGNYIDNTDPVNPVSVVPLNNTAVVNPTVNDDNTLGYFIDSKWFNSVSGTLWTCEDATTGAAVWTAVTAPSVQNNPTAVVAPTVNDDSGSGYSIGSYWFDTVTRTLYIAQDVTLGAAVWDAVVGILNNPTAVVAPGVNDDSSAGYSVGSYWFDTATATLYIAQDVTVGAAVWDSVTGGSSGAGAYTVNADETESTWYIETIQSPHSATSTSGSFWQFSPSAAILNAAIYANGSILESAGSMSAYTNILQTMLGGVSFSDLQFDATTNIRMKCVSTLPVGTDVSGGGSYRSGFIGFSEAGTADAGDITDAGVVRVGFGTYNGDIYAITGDNVTVTSVNLGAYAATVNSLYQIILDGISTAYFYLNGVLVATIITSIPTTGNVRIQTSVSNGGGGSRSLFISNITYGQQL